MTAPSAAAAAVWRPRRNHTDAGIGDRVLIEGETGRVLGLAALVYMLPLVLFFIGYAIGNAAGGGAAGALAGGVLFALGIIGAIFYSRRMKQNGEVPFEITHRL